MKTDIEKLCWVIERVEANAICHRENENGKYPEIARELAECWELAARELRKAVVTGKLTEYKNRHD